MTAPTMTDLHAPDTLAPQPLSHARALPARYYTGSAASALDARAVFARSWQLVGHETQLPDAGDYLVTEIAGLPRPATRHAAGHAAR